LLLNDWLSVSSGARTLARDAAVGMFSSDLADEARHLSIPGVTADPHFSGVYCCGTGSALVLKTVYYDQCTPRVGPSCPEVQPSDPDRRCATGFVAGTCNSWMATPPVACLHPAPPKSGSCNGHACSGDSVVLTLTAAGAQVITPLVRPFFSSTGTCPDNSTP